MKYYFEDIEVHILQSVVDIFEGFRQKTAWQHESGGILLGRIYPEKIVIEKASAPNKKDKSGRYFFERDVKTAQKIVNDSWNETCGEVVYFGEWHTHPENNPTPSLIDKMLITNMLRDTKMEVEFLFLVIVGISNDYVAIQKKGSVIIELNKVNTI